MENLELASSIRSVVSNMHKRLRKQVYQCDNLSITELAVLSHLYREELYPSDLAAIAKIKPQSMSQVLNRLETSDLVQRRAAKEDKRKVLISLTKHGREMVERTRYERDEWLAKAIGNTLSEKEIKALLAIVPILEKLVNVP